MNSISKSMRACPMRAYREPAYPTGAGISEADLSRTPVRWRGLKAVASTLGAAAMSLKGLALEAQDVPKPAPVAPVAAVPDAKMATESEDAMTPATEVCPLPAKEIAGDGYGAFGCVATIPAVILPEGEALDIIEKEFAKRGIKLVDCPVVEGTEVPKMGRENELSSKDRPKMFKKVLHGELPLPIPRERRRTMLDFASEDGSLVVEYVSEEDQYFWICEPWGFSSVYETQTRLAAEEAVRCLRTRTEGKPLKVGVFYDPCAPAPTEARKKLVSQIEHFFEFLAKHPPASANAR